MAKSVQQENSANDSERRQDQSMSLQEETEIDCPYCGERIMLLIDCTVAFQDYIEDCQVCCRPINLRVTVDEEGLPQVDLSRDDG